MFMRFMIFLFWKFLITPICMEQKVTEISNLFIFYSKMDLACKLKMKILFSSIFY